MNFHSDNVHYFAQILNCKPAKKFNFLLVVAPSLSNNKRMATLSVIIITKNEAHDIGACLDSVRWADEIIVVDSGSTDDTVAICRTYTDKVFITDWPGYGPQKNRALNYATQEWVLSLDADEQVTPALREEIQSVLQAPHKAGYQIPRQSTYCGKLIRYGAWRQKPVLRLFQRQLGKFDDAIVHENVLVAGPIGYLKAPLLHHTYQNLEEMLEKMNAYSSASALQKYKAGKKGGLFSALVHGLWAFLRSYVLQLGFLDGKFGFILAISNAEYAYYRYLKLMLYRQRPRT